MGQLLSIPFVVAGIYFVWKAFNKNNETHEIKRNSK
jgi:prolipoprotein diacylglyceryltransferase